MNDTRAARRYRFPQRRRLFDQKYNSIRSDRFHEHVAEVLRRHPQVAVVCDEIYEFLLAPGHSHHSFAAVAPDLADRPGRYTFTQSLQCLSKQP